MAQHNYTPYREIAKKLEVQQGDHLLLTSDILKLAIKARKAEKEFDVNAFLDSFIEALGPQGTLLIPAYNFDLEDGDSFSILNTMPMTGSLAVAAMQRKDFIRTSNPMHSFLVCGKQAASVVEMNNSSSFGPDSPFAHMHRQNAMMVFAGTSLAEAMTFTHFVEETQQVKYRKYKKMVINYTDKDSNTENRLYKIYGKKPGWTMALQGLEEKLPGDILRIIHINGIPFSTIRCKDAFEAVSRDIRENNAALVAGFSTQLFVRDIIKDILQRFNLFRTTYGKIRSGKRIH